MNNYKANYNDDREYIGIDDAIDSASRPDRVNRFDISEIYKAYSGKVTEPFENSDELNAVIEEINHGDVKARNTLIEKTTRFASGVALDLIKERCGLTKLSKQDVEDIIQEAQVANVKAARAYRSTEGSYFAYAKKVITNEVGERLIQLTDPILAQHSRGSKSRQLIMDFYAFRSKYRAEYGIDPDKMATIRGMGITEKDYIKIFEATNTKITHIEDMKTPDGRPVDIKDESFERDMARKEAFDQIASLLECLNPREKEYILLCYGVGGCDKMKKSDIAKRDGISQARVNQVITEGQEKMKKYAAKLERDTRKPNDIER